MQIGKSAVLKSWFSLLRFDNFNELMGKFAIIGL
jgi:hypothetical protein